MKAEGANAISVGQAAGFDITHEDLEEHASDEISPENLQSVAGGGAYYKDAEGGVAGGWGGSFSINKAFTGSFKKSSKAYPDFWVPSDKNSAYPDTWQPTRSLNG